MTEKKIQNKKVNKVLQSWECCKCGSVYAIWVSECSTCKNSNIRTVTPDGTYISPEIGYRQPSAVYITPQTKCNTCGNYYPTGSWHLCIGSGYR